MFRPVAFAGNDGVFHLVAFFILHDQWLAVGGNQLHFDLAVRAILGRVRGMVGQAVLIADSLADIVKGVSKRRLEQRGIILAAGHLGKALQLVVSLGIGCAAT